MPELGECERLAPISLSHRNFITKIVKYERVVNIPNSMTVLTEMLPASLAIQQRIGFHQADALIHSYAHDGEKIIVAVVGAGHCPGLLEKLANGEDRRRPETVLPGLVNTKKRIATDHEINSLVTDIVQFDYSYALENEIQTQ
jgi:pheromone shutdown protein TraB